MLLADDTHWLDRPTTDVLAFLARRLDAEPIVLLAIARDGEPSRLDTAGLCWLRVDRLPEEAAAELLDTVAPGFAPPVPTRLLREASGNPLALTELPLAAGLDSTDPVVLPLTERLERTFSARVAALPAATRTGLLIAALNNSDSLIRCWKC